MSARVHYRRIVECIEDANLAELRAVVRRAGFTPGSEWRGIWLREVESVESNPGVVARARIPGTYE